MTSDIIIAIVMPIVGLSMAVGVVFWQSWRDGVLHHQMPRSDAAPDNKK